MTEQSLVPGERITSVIWLVRGQKVMFDADLAALYGVDTRTFNQAVQRNVDRFPADFMFRLTKREFEDLRRQIGISSEWGGRRYAPYAFTEQGVAMLSSVLNSDRAIEVNIAIMRAFVRMREAMISHKEMARRIDEMERKYDGQFKAVFDAIRRLMEPPVPSKKRPIGYIIHEDDA